MYIFCKELSYTGEDMLVTISLFAVVSELILNMSFPKLDICEVRMKKKLNSVGAEKHFLNQV